MDLRNLRRCHPSNSMPSLISRLDRLDSMMRYIESKKCSSERWSNDEEATTVVKRECVPLDFAVKEAQSKGSILDRITSLEDRLIQLCLDMESEAESPSKTCEEEQHPTSCISRKNLFSNSFSRFRPSLRNHNHKLPMSRACIDNFDVRKEKEEHFKAYPSSEDSDSQGKHNKKTKNKKSSPKYKKLHPSNLSHLRLLGC